MALDPELQPIVDLVNAVEQPPPSEERVQELRDSFAGLVSMLGPGSDEVEVQGTTIPGPAGDLRVRTYRRKGADGLLPGLVWLHGGGWVIGDLDTHDALCRDLAAASGAAVVSIAYRLAPEHRFPAAHDDAEAAVAWLLAHGDELGVDPTRLAVGGDSAGGQLATVTCRRLRDRAATGDAAATPAAQVLVYPVTDLASPSQHPSREQNASGYLLTAETMDFFTEAYLPDPADRSSPDASPLCCEDLSGLPPALVVVAGYDPLRDEGIAYAGRLEQAGVPVTLHHLEGGVHLCAQMPGTAIGRRVVGDVAAFLAEHL
ncbi:MAG TPA: alpha/beta hydrolase [Microthrixaceae bacterium]|nr:alpha/beta hydrolase [Microthrixaceae bacterium]